MKPAYLIRLFLAISIAMLGSCRSTQNDAKEALADELSARQENRVRSMQLYEQGVAAQKQSQQAEARKCFSAAIEADGDNAYAWMALGAIEFDEANYYRAAEAFHLASKLVPTRYEPHLNAGTVYETVGRYADAIKSYEAALRLDSDQLESAENLARTYIRANQNLDRAKELIDRTLLREQRSEWRQWLLMQSVRLSCTKPPAPADDRGQRGIPSTRASARDAVTRPFQRPNVQLAEPTPESPKEHTP